MVLAGCSTRGTVSTLFSKISIRWGIFFKKQVTILGYNHNGLHGRASRFKIEAVNDVSYFSGHAQVMSALAKVSLALYRKIFTTALFREFAEIAAQLECRDEFYKWMTFFLTCWEMLFYLVLVYLKMLKYYVKWYHNIAAGDKVSDIVDSCWE